jgi:hypothetical protein
MVNMKMNASQLTSREKEIVQIDWARHTRAYQYPTPSVTRGLERYLGRSWATVKMAWEMKMGPQIEKAHPIGVTRVWYLRLFRGGGEG